MACQNSCAFLLIAGTEAQRILVVCMKQLAETPPMGAFDHKGHCVYANTPLAAMLGYTLKVLKTKDISQLMPQPYGVMHLKYVKVRPQVVCECSTHSVPWAWLNFCAIMGASPYMPAS